MNLRICVVPAKILADGTHKIRIAMSHNGTTRYFVTRFIVHSEKNIVNGRVVGVDNATYINKQLAQKVGRIYETYDKIEDSEYLTCSQLLSLIEENMVSIKPKTLLDIADEYLESLKSKSLSPNSIYIYKKGIEEMRNYFGKDFLVKSLNTSRVNQYMLHLKERLSNTTTGIRMRFLKLSVSFAIRHRYVTFDVSPFEDVHIPKTEIRDCAISLEDLRKFRDMKIPSIYGKNYELSRNLFMASFFLCGMNLIDLMSVDFSGDEVSYIRAKTKSRKRNEQKTTFSIQPEAREYLNKILKDGKIACTCKYDVNNLRSITHLCIKELADILGIEGNVMFYSARKTFTQLANELMIKDSIIEYCIGDTPTISNKVIGHYVSVNQRMADKAIRKVFDAVASNKSIDELMEDI